MTHNRTKCQCPWVLRRPHKTIICFDVFTSITKVVCKTCGKLIAWQPIDARYYTCGNKVFENRTFKIHNKHMRNVDGRSCR